MNNDSSISTVSEYCTYKNGYITFKLKKEKTNIDIHKIFVKSIYTIQILSMYNTRIYNK